MTERVPFRRLGHLTDGEAFGRPENVTGTGSRPHKEISMERLRRLLYLASIAVVAGGLAAPAAATTLQRAGLDNLVAGNRTIVLGEVVDTVSYWNDEGTFILTDVHLLAHEVVKGAVEGSMVTVTLMGGSVGDLTTIIIGGAELVPGPSYLLFLDRTDLPGVKDARTVKDHVQGVFEVKGNGSGGLRTVSEAARFGLVPDELGRTEPPGGVEGLPLDVMIQSIRALDRTHRSAAPEVK